MSAPEGYVPPFPPFSNETSMFYSSSEESDEVLEMPRRTKNTSLTINTRVTTLSSRTSPPALPTSTTHNSGTELPTSTSGPAKHSPDESPVTEPEQSTSEKSVHGSPHSQPERCTAYKPIPKASRDLFGTLSTPENTEDINANGGHDVLDPWLDALLAKVSQDELELRLKKEFRRVDMEYNSAIDVCAYWEKMLQELGDITDDRLKPKLESLRWDVVKLRLARSNAAKKLWELDNEKVDDGTGGMEHKNWRKENKGPLGSLIWDEKGKGKDDEERGLALGRLKSL